MSTYKAVFFGAAVLSNTDVSSAGMSDGAIDL